MSIKELAQVIGKRGSMTYCTPSGTLRINVNIKDVRQTFGRIDYQVVPMSGDGLMWIESSRVTLEPETF